MKKNMAVVGLFVVVLALTGACYRQGKVDNSGNRGGSGPLSRVYFDFDDSSVRSDAAPILESNAAWIKSNSGARVTVEGHCDDRGTNEYNLALGDRRASSVKNYLVNLGVDPSVLSSVSYGEERPLDPGANESAWAQNRRAEFVAQ